MSTPYLSDSVFQITGAQAPKEQLSKLDQELFRGKVCSLMYTVKFRVDVFFVVTYLIRFLNNPDEKCVGAINRVYRYLLQHADYEIIYSPNGWKNFES